MEEYMQNWAMWLGQPQKQVLERLYQADFIQSGNDFRGYEHQRRLLEYVALLNTTVLGVRYLARPQIEFFDHQADSFVRVLTSDGHRQVLADEVGLGKTIEAGLFVCWLAYYRPSAKVLIVAPKTLTRQWRDEMMEKFDISVIDFKPDELTCFTLIYPEQLADETIWEVLSATAFDLIIVDEAHRLLDKVPTHQRLVSLSREAQHCLVLSATPIRRDAIEYHALLQLVEPRIYCQISRENFQSIAQHQKILVEFLVKWRQKLENDDFKARKFSQEFSQLSFFVANDDYLRYCKQQLETSEDADAQEKLAEDILSYLEHIYRIESRIVRHRRRDLVDKVLAKRRFEAIPYKAHGREREVSASLQHSIRQYLQQYPNQIDYAQLLLGAFASSPEALQGIVEARLKFVSRKVMPPLAATIKDKITALPISEDEGIRLDSLLQMTKIWQEDNSNATRNWLKHNIPPNIPYRFLQAIRILKQNVQQKSKTVVFCHFPQTLDAMFGYLLNLFGQVRVAQFNRLSGGKAEKLQEEAMRFSQDERCLILLCDEMGEEGKNFQMATHILHLDLPWSPYEVEQRIGRVDRIGKVGEVVSQVIYARNTVEEDLLKLWQDGLGIFERSISGLEMVIEQIYRELQWSLADSLNDGLKDLVQHYQQLSSELEERLEEESYWSQELSKRGLGKYIKQDREKLKEKLKARQSTSGATQQTFVDISKSTIALEVLSASIPETEEILHCVVTVQPNVAYVYENKVSHLDFELMSGFFREPVWEFWVTLKGEILAEDCPLVEEVKLNKRRRILDASTLDSRSDAWREGIKIAYDTMMDEVKKHHHSLLSEVRPKAQYILRQQLHQRVASAVYRRQSKDRALIEQTLKRNQTLLHVLENPVINLVAATYWRVTPDVN